MFKNEKPYISLLFKPLAFELGPETLPKQTSCLNCKRLWELTNITDGNLIKEFDTSNIVSNQYILEELLYMAFSLVNVHILSTILNMDGFNIELGLTQHTLEYDYLNDNLTNHNVLKSPKCQLCFPQYEKSFNQTFEV